MTQLDYELTPAATKQEYEAFQQFLVDSSVISAPDVLPVYQEPPKKHTGIGEDWKRAAACKDISKEVFYDRSRIIDVEKKELRDRICGSCAVRTTCVVYAFEHNEKHGVWGGFDFEKSKDRVHARDYLDSVRIDQSKSA